MESEKNSYRQIIKATSLFGGVQIFTILISIAKSKIAALLIGVSGFGIFGLLSSTLNLISGITRLGLDISSVKEIASANNDLDKDRISTLVNVTKRLTWVTGVVGSIISLILSQWLSFITFGNENYTLFFIIISIAILFNQLTIGNLSVLQGLKNLKRLAKVTVFTSFFSLIPTLIIYYLFGENGIPWVILITAIIGYFLSKHYVDKLKIIKLNIPYYKLVVEGKSMMKLGVVLSLASLSTLFVGYLIQVFITNMGSINEVGLYNAGFALIHSYVAVFFNALSKDFFPRLSEISKDNMQIKKLVNQQASMSILLLTPIIILFLVFKPFIISLLYTKEFLPVMGMITYGILAILFKAVSWSMGFILIVKGNTKLYLTTELISNSILLALVIIGYNLNGLTGIGLAYLTYYIIDLSIVKFIVTKKYAFCFDSKFINLFYMCVFQCLITLGLLQIENQVLKFCMMGLVVLISLVFTFAKLNSYISLTDLIKEKLNK
ncbi:MAG TPA: oligosaccharide flippase family protein [Yeosuana sp.]